MASARTLLRLVLLVQLAAALLIAWALLHRGVLIHPGHFFDFDREPFAVLSLLPTPDDFDAGLEILHTALQL